jgi:hypothetical protein
MASDVQYGQYFCVPNREPKWRIKIRFFYITLRVSNIISIFFLHSFGVGKTQILLDFFIQDGGWNGKVNFSRHLAFFEKLFFHKNCVLPTSNECKKKIEKLLDTLRVMSKKLILICHFGSNRHF